MNEYYSTLVISLTARFSLYLDSTRSPRVLSLSFGFGLFTWQRSFYDWKLYPGGVSAAPDTPCLRGSQEAWHARPPLCLCQSRGEGISVSIH